MKNIFIILLAFGFIKLYSQSVPVTINPINSGATNQYLKNVGYGLTKSGDTVIVNTDAILTSQQKIVDADWFGASPSNTAYLNYQYIQEAIDASYSHTIIIGNDTTETYLISQPLIIPSGKKLIINGKLKVMDGKTAALGSDVAAGATSFTISSVANFSVGEWIAVYDTTQTYNYDAYWGWAGRIDSINGTTVYMNTVAPYQYDTDSGDVVAHVNSAIILNNVDDVIISGNGIIDGNRYNQEQIHTIHALSVDEQQRTGCGIVVYGGCNNIKIEGIKVKNCLMHNISITSVTSGPHNTNIYLSNIISEYEHDKNFLIRFTDYVFVNNIQANNATWEDGLMFYGNVTNAFVDGVFASGNKRYGFGWNSLHDSMLVASNIITQGTINSGIYISAKYANLSNIICRDRITLSNAYDCRDIIMSNVTITGSSLSEQLYISGAVKRVTINGLYIYDNTGDAIKTYNLLGGVAEDIKIIGGGIYNHTGTSEDYDEGNDDITFTAFDGVAP